MAESERPLVVFIYGTLKRGFPNIESMPKSAKYMGLARTTVPWPLVVDSEMSVPFLLRVADHPDAKVVQGELYHVDEAAIEVLDNFEGLGTGFYDRKEVEVISSSSEPGRIADSAATESDGGPTESVITASAYFRSPRNGGPSWAHKWTLEKLLTLPMVDTYSEEHAKTFIPPTDR